MPTGRRSEAGFTMAAMVIIMAVMAILLTVAVQTATFQKRRENEAELIFRGEQIVEGIRLFQAKFGRHPLSLEELAKAKPRVMRKTWPDPWKDPITGQADWKPVFLGQEGQRVGPTPTGGAQPTPTPPPTPPGGRSGPGTRGGPGNAEQGAPIIGVHSRSCETSIKIYNGRTRYCDWKFTLTQQQQQNQPNPAPTK